MTKILPPRKRLVAWSYILLGGFLIFYLGFLLFRSAKKSVFYDRPDRLNLVFYGSDATFYSIASGRGQTYLMYFYPDLKMTVPGGYANYHVGSLGKLADLEKKPEIIAKAFGVAVSSYIDLYFYPRKTEVYYGTKTPEKTQTLPFWKILTYKSNATVIDRIILIWVAATTNMSDIATISYRTHEVKLHDESFFENDSFSKNAIGLLFRTIFRDEKKNTKIVYSTDYTTAYRLGKMLEGMGIRVNDLSQGGKNRGRCQIVENSQSTSRTAKGIAGFFGCEIKSGKTDFYDIIFYLNGVEKEWEM